MTLDAVEWARLRALFDEMQALPLPDRERRLQVLSAMEPALHGELHGLLAAADSVGGRFEVSAAELVGLDDEAPAPGHQVGPWRIIREVGHGGMGTVYEAHRVDDQFEKRVALKTVAPGRASAALLQRFRHERQILARLEHRNIATFLDGGVTPAGQPFFVMEFVEGEPLDRWCEARQAGAAQRVQLFRQVCAAVQYAHEHLVIHRDLKPRNILVSADGSVKLLDFGIAKLLDPTQSGDALTETGALPMTAVYASPEQRHGQPVTTATDIYSLGVILYELLAGRRPYGPEAPDIGILDQQPQPPSRGVTDRARRAELQGDLDSIVLKAMRPEPDQRYRSAQAVADDLGRYLAGDPVTARAGALGYRLGKLVRRHKAAVIAAIVALAALVTATAVSVGQARTARGERDNALREAERTRQVTAFFQEVLSSARPQRMGRSVSVMEAIDSAIAKAGTAFPADPDLRASLKLTLGSTLNDMFLYDQARPLLEDAYRLQREIDAGAPSQAQADALYDLADIEAQVGDAGRAESLYRVSLAMMGRLARPDSADIWQGWSNVAEAMLAQGRLVEGAALYDTVAGALDRLRPDDVELRGITRANRGTALAQLGRYAEAEPVLREAVALFEASSGRESIRVAAALQPLAGTLVLNRKYGEAEQAAARSVEIYTRELGPYNPATLSSRRMITAALVESGRCAAAQPHLGEMLALRGKELAEGDPTLGVILLQHGQCQLNAGALALAELTLRDALAVRRTTFGESHWAVAQVESLLGEVLARRNRPEEAATRLRSGYEGLRSQLGETHPRTVEARERLRNQ